MDDKIYRGPGHPVGAHFHSGPKGERGLPGVSPKVDMEYNEDDGAVVFTVSDGYGQREQAVPVEEIVKEWADESGPGAIDQWLDDHPEATTTVQDGTITRAKLNAELKNYVMPEFFGAVGDGTTDDTAAWQSALDVGGVVFCKPTSNYLITGVLRIKGNTTIHMNGCTVTCNQKRWLFNFLNTDEFTEYNGNGNIHIADGNVVGGSVSFWHGENIEFDNVRFHNCINDHYFEICACKNFIIRNCRFVGMKNRESSVLEYINIDPLTSEPSTYFTGSSYPSGNYDGTRNDGVLILNCYFNINEDDSEYAYMEDAIGCHAPLGMFHNNIQIIGNTILNYTDYAIRFDDMENSIVRDNYIESSTTNNHAIHMNDSNGTETYNNKNSIIENNTIKSAAYCFRIGNALNLIVRNNLFDFGSSAKSMCNIRGTTTGLTLTQNQFYHRSGGQLYTVDHDKTGSSIFAALQKSKVTGLTIASGNASATLARYNWTEFDTIEFEFGYASSGTLFRATANAFGNNGECFKAGSTYPIIRDNLTNTAIFSFTVSSENPNVITFTKSDESITIPNVRTIYASKYAP